MPFLKKSTHDVGAFTVYCVCGGIGFPTGTASANRIRLIGKCLVSKGIPFHVWHIGPSSFKENFQKFGKVDGLTYKYLSPSVRRPKPFTLRAFYYLWGCMILSFRLLCNRSKSIVYVYYQGDIINLLALWICRLLNIPSVQEACEWWPGTARGTHFKKWMYRKIMFRWSKGAITISHEIRNRIQNLSSKNYRLCLVPVLIDPSENILKHECFRKNNAVIHEFLWCGMVDGYKRDVLFLIDALAALRSGARQNTLLHIVGPCSKRAKAEVLSYASSKNLLDGQIRIAGFVTDSELWAFCRKAAALLMPLWDDDRSKTRFPTKLGQYVAAGRPIITAKVGEIKHYLTDKSALFYLPGDAGSLAQCLERLIENPDIGKVAVAHANQDVLPKLDYRSIAHKVSQWFCKIHSERQNA